MKKAVEIFRHGFFGHERLVVSKADIGFSGERPVNEIFIGAFLSVFRIFVQMRRIVGAKQFSIAQEYQASLGGFDGVRDVAPRFGFFLKRTTNSAPGGAIGFDLDAGILGFEGFDHLLVRVAGERSVPNYFAFGFCSGVKHASRSAPR